MKKKKLLSFLTSAVMAATCLGGGLSELTSRINLVNEPLTAEAYDGTAYGDYLYYETVDEDYVYISDCDESAVSVEIPAEIDGLPVTSIGSFAFSDCSSLASITIPDSVTSIGDATFYGTALLANQTGVKYADTWVIDCDTDVTSAEIKDGTRGIADYAFYDCSSLAGITIPDSVTSIGYGAFEGCSSLESITIPDSVTSIGGKAFEGCTSLESIVIPDSVTKIGVSVFYGCSSLKNVKLSNNITSLSSYVNGTIVDNGFFGICKSLESITIPDSVTSIGNWAFEGCTSLASITIPDSVTSIGSSAFSGCSSLANITIPDSVTSIGSSAFKDCSSLENVYISDIEAWCNIDFSSSSSNPLYYAHNLYINNELTTDVIVPDGVTSIKSYAFYNCTSLESITIPDSVTSIGLAAFYGCNKMLQITIPATVETIGEKAIGYSSAGNIITGFKIYGVSGTAAETYALANGITFIDVNNTPYMSKTELSLNVGDNFVLEVKNFSGDIAWSSNDSSIATVKEGLVSAVGAGETVVYAIIGDSVLKCSVIVQPGGTVTTTATTTSASTSTTVTTTSIVSTTASSSGTTPETTAQTTTVPVTTTSSAPETTTSETVPVTTVNTDIFDVKENNGTFIIVNCDNLVVNVIVPETIDGKTVSKVSDYALSGESIESVQFENPDIEIFDSATTINEDAVIYGYWDSTAHVYAKKYNRKFVSLDGEPEYLPGDISGNDKIDLYDAIEICKSIMGMRTFTETEKQIADFDGNGKVDLYDAIGIAKKLLEK